MKPKFNAALLATALTAVASGASAQVSKGFTTCATNECTWSMSLQGADGALSASLSGFYRSDADGNLFLTDNGVSGTTRVLSDEFGNSMSINDVNGNIDPIIGFGLGAGTAAVGSTFTFAFNLPIALSGPIFANSSVSYSLTSKSAAGAQVQPFASKVVTAKEVDSTVGGVGSFNKGVDVGNTFFFVGGPATQNSPVYTATNSFAGNMAYDLMSVVVSFTLSPNANVGVSGFVQQVIVPEPESALLLLAGLAVVGARLRRSAV